MANPSVTSPSPEELARIQAREQSEAEDRRNRNARAEANASKKVVSPERREKKPSPGENQPKAPTTQTPVNQPIDVKGVQSNPVVPDYAAQNKDIVFKPGDVGYEKGFRTYQEQLFAEKYGLSYGIHPGNLVPDSSVVVNVGKRQFRVTDKDLTRKNGNRAFKGIISRIQKGKYRAAITAVSETGEKTTITVTKEQADQLSKLKGEALFNALQRIGAISGEKVFTSQAITKGLSHNEKKFLKDKPQELQETYKKGGAAAYNRAVEKYNKQLQADLNKQVSALPAALQAAYKKGGITALNNAIEAYNRELERNYTKLPNGDYIANPDLANLSPEAQKIIKTQGIAAYNQALEKAKKTLKPYIITEGGLVYTPNALEPQRNPGYDVQAVLKDIKFKHDAKLNQAANLMFDQQTLKDLRKSMPLFSDNALTRRIAELMVERPHLEGYQAYQIAKVELKHKGIDVVENLPKAQVNEVLKLASIDTVGRVVPGVYTAYFWNKLPAEKQLLAVGVDVASVLGMYLGFKGVSAIAKRVAGISNVEKLAAEAGKAGNKLKGLTSDYEKVLTTNKPTIPESVKVRASNAVELARAESMKADNAFLDALLKLDKVDSASLKAIETKSGIKGLRQAIIDIRNAQNRLSNSWDYVNGLKYYTNPETAAQITANKAYLFGLKAVQDAQAALENTLSKAGSILKPRYTLSPEPDQFKGYKVNWKLDTSAKGPTQTVLDIITDPESTGRLAKAVKVVAPEKIPTKMELKPAYESPKPVEKPRVTSVPKVDTSSDTFKVLFSPKKTSQAQETALTPAERHELGTMTAAQREKYRKTVTEDFVDARATTILNDITAQSPYTTLKGKELTDLQSAIKNAIKAQEIAKIKGLTQSETKAAIESALETEPAAKTEALVKTITETITETATKTETRKPLRGGIIGLPGDKQNKEIRSIVLKSKGAIGWKQGQVGKRNVFAIIVYPYKKGNGYLYTGSLPPNMTVVKGKGSARKTAKLLYGKLPTKTLMADIGAFDAKITPTGNSFNLSFKPDPKLQTNNEIKISGKGAFPLPK